MGWLQDTVALVTGAGSGLGRAIVERYVEEGARVGVLELNEAKAEALRTAVRRAEANVRRVSRSRITARISSDYGAHTR